MPQDDPNRQSTHSPGLSEKGLDEADALGPEYRQRITPISQAFLSPKRLETVSRPSMTVLNLTSKAQPFGVVQRWPLEQLGALGDEIAPSHHQASPFHNPEVPLSTLQRQPLQTEQSTYHAQNEPEASTQTPAPDFQPDPGPPPVQISKSVRLPNPVQRSPQLQRQVKQTKAKTLQSLQSQSSQPPTTANAPPQKPLTPSVQKSVIQTQQEPSTPENSVAETPPTPPPAIPPPGHQPTAQPTSDPVLEPPAQRSPDNTETTEPTPGLDSSGSSPAVQASAAPDSAPSTDSPLSDSTDVEPTAAWVQRPETVKQRVQRTKSRILQTLQTTDTSPSSAAAPLQRHPQDQSPAPAPPPSIQSPTASEPTPVSNPPVQRASDSALPSQPEPPPSGDQATVSSSLSTPAEPASISDQETREPISEIIQRSVEDAVEVTAKSVEADRQNLPESIQRKAGQPPSPLTRKGSEKKDLGAASPIPKESLESADYTHVSQSSSLPSSLEPSPSAPLEVTSTPSLQRATTDTDTASSETAPSAAESTEIGLQRERIPDPQDTSADLTSPLRSQPPPDSPATVANAPAPQRQSDTERIPAKPLETDIHPPSESIQRQAEHPQVPLTGEVSEETDSASASSIQRDPLGDADQTVIFPDPSTPVEAVSTPSLQPAADATNRSAPVTDPVTASSTPAKLGAQSQPLQPSQTPISTSPQEAVEPTAKAIQRSIPDQEITAPATEAVQRSPAGVTAETIRATDKPSETDIHPPSESIQRQAEPPQAPLTGEISEAADSVSASPIQREPLEGTDQPAISPDSSTPIEATSTPSLSQAPPDSPVTIADQPSLSPAPPSSTDSPATVAHPPTLLQRQADTERGLAAATDEPSKTDIPPPSESIQRQAEPPQPPLKEGQRDSTPVKK